MPPLAKFSRGAPRGHNSFNNGCILDASDRAKLLHKRLFFIEIGCAVWSHVTQSSVKWCMNLCKTPSSPGASSIHVANWAGWLSGGFLLQISIQNLNALFKNGLSNDSSGTVRSQLKSGPKEWPKVTFPDNEQMDPPVPKNLLEKKNFIKICGAITVRTRILLSTQASFVCGQWWQQGEGAQACECQPWGKRLP